MSGDNRALERQLDGARACEGCYIPATSSCRARHGWTAADKSYVDVQAIKTKVAKMTTVQIAETVTASV